MGHDYYRDRPAIQDTQQSLRVVKVTFVALILTALVQGIISLLSGSAALQADTLHGLSNAFTTLPLWIAFSLSRRRPNSQYPYGYHRAEDLVGVIILLFIGITAALIGYESVRKLSAGQEPRNLPYAMAAGAIGFLVNQAIAQYRIRVGSRINSPALIADGNHARVDGLGSLAVVLGLTGVALGFPVADPAVGLAITGLIVYLLVREAGPMVLSRVLDRIDPELLSQIQRVASEVPGVRSARDVRARWVGHRLQAELTIGVDADLTIARGHAISEQVQHRLMHSVTRFQWATIHVVPYQDGRQMDLEVIGHHIDPGLAPGL